MTPYYAIESFINVHYLGAFGSFDDADDEAANRFPGSHVVILRREALCELLNNIKLELR